MQFLANAIAYIHNCHMFFKYQGVTFHSVVNSVLVIDTVIQAVIDYKRNREVH